MRRCARIALLHTRSWHLRTTMRHIITAFRGASAASDEKCKETSISRREATRKGHAYRTNMKVQASPDLDFAFSDLRNLRKCEFRLPQTTKWEKCVFQNLRSVGVRARCAEWV